MGNKGVFARIMERPASKAAVPKAMNTKLHAVTDAEGLPATLFHRKQPKVKAALERPSVDNIHLSGAT